jgi:hypothetical protein
MGCESSDPMPPFNNFDTLRIESTFVINHDVRREREQWAQLFNFLSIDDLRQLESMYTVKDVKIAQRPVPWLVYQRDGGRLGGRFQQFEMHLNAVDFLNTAEQ